MMDGKKKLPTGIDDFKKMRENCYFIDKTAFIADIIDETPATEVTLLTRPRRFGKSTNLSMLSYFFSLKDAAENRNLFRGLNIERMDGAYMEKQGKFPVIFMSFKNIQLETFDLLLQRFASTLSDLFAQHMYILESSDIAAHEKSFFTAILQKKGSQEDLGRALLFLTKMLYMVFKKKVIVLLDEYDVPVDASWKYGYYDRCICFIRDLLGSCLKSNIFLEFSVITGVMRISKESIFSGLNNIKVYSVLSTKYSRYFGFTEDEVVRIMNDFDAIDKFEELKELYDGYLFGDTEIYNPWSVIEYIKEGCKPEVYWVNTSINDVLKEYIKSISKEKCSVLESLLRGESVITSIDENITYADLYTDETQIFTILLFAGYLKVCRATYEYEGWVYDVQIPNKEVRKLYRDEILDRLSASHSTSLHAMLRAMVCGDTECFEKKLGDILAAYVSSFDTGLGEAFYHGLMLGFTILLEEMYRVESNRESGYGRFDIALFPKRAVCPGIILEFKVAQSKKGVQKKAKLGCRQIQMLSYDTAFRKEHIKTIWHYGIAFFGKNVSILRQEGERL